MDPFEETLRRIREDIRRQRLEELRDRLSGRFSYSYSEQHHYGMPSPEMSRSGVDVGAVSALFRRLAKKWHPDVGGTTEAMQALNEAHAELKKLFAQS